MVFFGYELPRKNNDIRLKNLQIGINNAKKRELNNLYQQEQTLSLNMDNLSQSSPTLPSIFTPSVLTRGLQKTDINEYNRVAITPKTAVNTPNTSSNLIDELKRKLAGTQLGLKKGLSKPEAEFKKKIKQLFDDKIKTKSEIADLSKLKIEFQEILNLIKQSGITDREEEIAQESINDFLEKLKQKVNSGKETESNAPTMASDDDLDLIKSKLTSLTKEDVDNFEKFLNFFTTNNEIFKPLNPMYNQNVKLPLPRAKSVAFNDSNIKKKTNLEKSYIYFKEDESAFKNTLLKINGFPGSAGLRGGRLVQGRYYNSWTPNFGNLHIQHKSLKKNHLVLTKPYSKTQLLGKKNITPLLKKIIFDIANTLEFDTKDYHNLDKDEKIIIEKIVRLQKDMKEVNIQKLLDDDDSKIKKRLEILVGEVNAGNSSSLIKKEMKELLRKLYDNKAISNNKYQTSLKSLNAI